MAKLKLKDSTLFDDDDWCKWDVWARKRHELKLKRIECGRSFNWNHFWLTLLGFFAVLIVAGLAFGAVVVGEYADAWSRTMEALSGSAVSIDGEYNGHFVNDVVRTLEKKDSSCIEEFNYGQLYNSTSSFKEDFEVLKDEGCVNYAVEGDKFLFKCPKHNCAVREVSVIQNTGVWVPDDVKIDSVKVNVGGRTR